MERIDFIWSSPPPPPNRRAVAPLLGGAVSESTPARSIRFKYCPNKFLKFSNNEPLRLPGTVSISREHFLTSSSTQTALQLIDHSPRVSSRRRKRRSATSDVIPRGGDVTPDHMISISGLSPFPAPGPELASPGAGAGAGEAGRAVAVSSSAPRAVLPATGERGYLL